MKFYTSDLHIQHELVANIRGYTDSSYHDADLARIWDATVHNNDSVWILGDLSMNIKKALPWYAARPGHKHIVWGNHDEGMSYRTKAHSYQRMYLSVFESVQPFAVHKFSHPRQGNSLKVALSHFPYKVDRYDDPREMQWRLPDMGMPLMHGHLHCAERVTSERELHVGWDAWGGPVPETIIVQTLDSMGLFQ